MILHLVRIYQVFALEQYWIPVKETWISSNSHAMVCFKIRVFRGEQDGEGDNAMLAGVGNFC